MHLAKSYPGRGVSRLLDHSYRDEVDFCDAIAIAARIYGGSRDRSGGLFLAHAICVAQELGPAATSTAMTVAVLHGIPKDTEWTIHHLAELGVDALVCEAVDTLTRRRGESYVDYVRRICEAPGLTGATARQVLAADLTISTKSAESDALRQRYEQSLPLVQSALATAYA